MHFSTDDIKEKILSDTVNTIINDNWKELLKEIQPAFEHTMAELMMSIVRPLFASIAYNDFFLD